MPTPFPGMDPYLENPSIWPNVHNSLIVALRDDLAPRLRPKYYVAVEERTYITEPAGGNTFVARPDVSVVHEPAVTYGVVTASVATVPITVELPVPDEITETYLQIQEVDSGRVVTVLEILSPTNKRPGRGRDIYERKRLYLLGTLTHLVEIDLLRAGTPPTTFNRPESHYAILVSRSQRRPKADLLPFNIPQPIPTFHLPLQKDDEEPEVDLGRLLPELYDRAGYDLRLDYTGEPDPPLDEETAEWVDAWLHEKGLRGQEERESV